MISIIKSFGKIALLVGAFSIISVSVTQAATQQSNARAEKAILQINPQKEISSIRAKQALQKAEFSYGEVKGNVQVKDKDISDSLVVKGKEKDINNLTKDYTAQRQTMLQKMLRQKEMGKEQSSIEEVSVKEIQDAMKHNAQNSPQIKSMTLHGSKKQMDGNSQRIQKELNLPSEALNQQKITPETKRVKKKNTQANVKEEKSSNGFFSGIASWFGDWERPSVSTAHAGGTWYPNYTSISFFDTAETGFYPFAWWKYADNENTVTKDTPTITYHWGRIYVMHTGTDGYQYMGSFNWEGKDWSGWSK